MIGRMYASVTASLPLMNGGLNVGSTTVQLARFNLSALLPVSAARRVWDMHIVAIVLAIAGGLAVWYWRFKMLGEAGRDVADMAGRVRGAYRMRKFRKQAEGAALNTIDDPAVAATVFLFALANEAPAARHLSEPKIKAQIGAIVDARELDEVIAYGAWAARDVADPKDLVRRFKPLWREQLTASERNDLIEMAEAIVAVGDGATPGQDLSLEALRTALAMNRTT